MPRIEPPQKHEGRLPALAAALSSLLVLTIPIFLLIFSLPLLEDGQWATLLSWRWRPLAGEFGILPMFAGSLLLAVSTLLLAFPFAVGLCAFAHGIGPQRAARPLLAAIRAMTSIPTVVYGLTSAFLLVPLIRNGFSGSGFSWLAAMLTLVLLVLPTMVLLIDQQFRQISSTLHLTASALGFDRRQQICRLILPLSGRGLRLAAILGFGRAIGDTLIPLMLAGNAPLLPNSPLDPLRTLTAHIALVVATDSQSAAYHSLFACGLLLFLISLMVNLGVRHLRNAPPLGSDPLAAEYTGQFWLRGLPSLAWGSTLLLTLLLASLLGFLLWQGGGALNLTLFFGDTPPLDALRHGAPVFDGIWPACMGTLCLVALAITLALLPGIASGIYLAEYARGRPRQLFSFVVELLAGVPSIVMGLAGFALILLLRRSVAPAANTCLLLSAGCLADQHYLPGPGKPARRTTPDRRQPGAIASAMLATPPVTRGRNRHSQRHCPRSGTGCGRYRSNPDDRRGRQCRNPRRPGEQIRGITVPYLLSGSGIPQPGRVGAGLCHGTGLDRADRPAIRRGQKTPATN